MYTQVDTEAISAEQSLRYSQAIGHGVPQEIINELHLFAQDARPPEIYSAHEDVPFLYEILAKDGWREEVWKLVDRWISDEKNIQRAAQQVQREAKKEGRSLVRGFCMFRLKEPCHKVWSRPESLGMGDHEPQTVLFVALEDLNPDNGFFLDLKQGQDICLDHSANIQFPPTGGGLGLFVALDL